jgi:hypothetical protein
VCTKHGHFYNTIGTPSAVVIVIVIFTAFRVAITWLPSTRLYRKQLPSRVNSPAALSDHRHVPPNRSNHPPSHLAESDTF